MYQTIEQILKNLPVRWYIWVRSVFYLFISIKNAPRKVRNLSLYDQSSRGWLKKHSKNPAPAEVEVYQEWIFQYSEVGATNEA